MAKISIVIPIHKMDNGSFFLWRCIQSIMRQSFKDYEIIITQEGKMARNTNAGLSKARGELVKILFMDDYFADDNALERIVKNCKGAWLVTGCLHDDGKEVGNYHSPRWTDDLYTGNNGIGSPSVLTMRRECLEYFDEQLSWLLDCDLYQRLYNNYGLPTILDTPNVVIGLGPHQTTHKLSDEEKQKEHEYLLKKYAA